MEHISPRTPRTLRAGRSRLHELPEAAHCCRTRVLIQAVIAEAQLAPESSIHPARVPALTDARAAGGLDLDSARLLDSRLSSHVLSLQETVQARDEELVTLQARSTTQLLATPIIQLRCRATQAEARHHAASAEMAYQEKAVLIDADTQLRAELQSQCVSSFALQLSVSQMSEAHADWKRAEQQTSARLQQECGTLRRDWAETRARLGRERDRLKDSTREADVARAAANAATASAATYMAAGWEEIARRGGHLATLKQMNEMLR